MSIRVLVVDDNADVRLLLRIGIDLRPGIEVVGEAENGVEAVHLAEELQPDIVILDREMPVADGLSVLPTLRERCPGALIVLYTAAANQDVHRAAAGGGADAVRTKGGQTVDALVDELQELLVGDGSEPDLVRLRVGPVDGHAARVWVANTRRILQALLQSPEEIPASVPRELLSVFCSILDEWALVAEDEETFYWSAAARVSTIEGLVLAWADLDRLDDDTMRRLGCTWSPPEARPFFESLTAGVVVALRRHEELKGIVRDLPEGWSRGAAAEAETVGPS